MKVARHVNIAPIQMKVSLNTLKKKSFRTLWNSYISTEFRKSSDQRLGNLHFYDVSVKMLCIRPLVMWFMECCFELYYRMRPWPRSRWGGIFGRSIGQVNTFKYHVFAPMGRFQLELIYLCFPPSSHLIYICFCQLPSNCQLPKPGDRSHFNTNKTC